MPGRRPGQRHGRGRDWNRKRGCYGETNDLRVQNDLACRRDHDDRPRPSVAPTVVNLDPDNGPLTKLESGSHGEGSLTVRTEGIVRLVLPGLRH